MATAISTAMRERITFATNIPTLLGPLAYSDGKLTEGRYGDQYQYVTETNQIAWVEPEVRDQILAAGVGEGDTVCITKREVRNGNRRRIAWEVAKVEEEPEQEPAAPLTPPARGTTPAAQQAVEHHRPQFTAPPQEPPYQAEGSALAAALCAAIDAAATAEAHANQRGYPVRFASEDIRAMAATLYIQQAKGGR